MCFLMELELILTELQSLEFSHFNQLYISQGIEFVWIILKTCILVVDKLKMCM